MADPIKKQTPPQKSLSDALDEHDAENGPSLSDVLDAHDADAGVSAEPQATSSGYGVSTQPSDTSRTDWSHSTPASGSPLPVWQAPFDLPANPNLAKLAPSETEKKPKTPREHLVDFSHVVEDTVRKNAIGGIHGMLQVGTLGGADEDAAAAQWYRVNHPLPPRAPTDYGKLRRRAPDGSVQKIPAGTYDLVGYGSLRQTAPDGSYQKIPDGKYDEYKPTSLEDAERYQREMAEKAISEGPLGAVLGGVVGGLPLAAITAFESLAARIGVGAFMNLASKYFAGHGATTERAEQLWQDIVHHPYRLGLETVVGPLAIEGLAGGKQAVEAVKDATGRTIKSVGEMADGFADGRLRTLGGLWMSPAERGALQNGAGNLNADIELSRRADAAGLYDGAILPSSSSIARNADELDSTAGQALGASKKIIVDKSQGSPTLDTKVDYAPMIQELEEYRQFLTDSPSSTSLKDIEKIDAEIAHLYSQTVEGRNQAAATAAKRAARRRQRAAAEPPIDAEYTPPAADEPISSEPETEIYGADHRIHVQGEVENVAPLLSEYNPRPDQNRSGGPPTRPVNAAPTPAARTVSSAPEASSGPRAPNGYEPEPLIPPAPAAAPAAVAPVGSPQDPRQPKPQPKPTARHQPYEPPANPNAPPAATPREPTVPFDKNQPFQVPQPNFTPSHPADRNGIRPPYESPSLATPAADEGPRYGETPKGVGAYSHGGQAHGELSELNYTPEDPAAAELAGRATVPPPAPTPQAAAATTIAAPQPPLKLNLNPATAGVAMKPAIDTTVRGAESPTIVQPAAASDWGKELMKSTHKVGEREVEQIATWAKEYADAPRNTALSELHIRGQEEFGADLPVAQLEAALAWTRGKPPIAAKLGDRHTEGLLSWLQTQHPGAGETMNLNRAEEIVKRARALKNNANGEVQLGEELQRDFGFDVREARRIARKAVHGADEWKPREPVHIGPQPSHKAKEKSSGWQHHQQIAKQKDVSRTNFAPKPDVQDADYEPVSGPQDARFVGRPPPKKVKLFTEGEKDKPQLTVSLLRGLNAKADIASRTRFRPEVKQPSALRQDMNMIEFKHLSDADREAMASLREEFPQLDSEILKYKEANEQVHIAKTVKRPAIMNAAHESNQLLSPRDLFYGALNDHGNPNVSLGTRAGRGFLRGALARGEQGASEALRPGDYILKSLTNKYGVPRTLGAIGETARGPDDAEPHVGLKEIREQIKRLTDRWWDSESDDERYRKRVHVPANAKKRKD